MRIGENYRSHEQFTEKVKNIDFVYIKCQNNSVQVFLSKFSIMVYAQIEKTEISDKQ